MPPPIALLSLDAASVIIISPTVVYPGELAVTALLAKIVSSPGVIVILEPFVKNHSAFLNKKHQAFKYLVFYFTLVSFITSFLSTGKLLF